MDNEEDFQDWEAELKVMLTSQDLADRIKAQLNFRAPGRQAE